MKHITQNNFKYNPLKHGYTEKLPSLTVPDESYSVKEILQKFTRGIDPMLTLIPDYDNEELNDDLSEEQFTVSPIRTITDLTDIGEIENFIVATKKNEKALQIKLKELKGKQDAENSASRQ